MTLALKPSRLACTLVENHRFVIFAQVEGKSLNEYPLAILYRWRPGIYHRGASKENLFAHKEIT
jgi:hypothetical protein